MKSLILRDNKNPAIPAVDIFPSDKPSLAAEIYIYGKGATFTYAEIEQIVKCLSSYLPEVDEEYFCE